MAPPRDDIASRAATQCSRDTHSLLFIAPDGGNIRARARDQDTESIIAAGARQRRGPKAKATAATTAAEGASGARTMGKKNLSTLVGDRLESTNGDDDISLASKPPTKETFH